MSFLTGPCGRKAADRPEHGKDQEVPKYDLLILAHADTRQPQTRSDNETVPQNRTSAQDNSMLSHTHMLWAARYNTWLLIKLTPKGVPYSY